MNEVYRADSLGFNMIYLRNLQNSEEESFTMTDLNTMVVAGKINYNKFTEESNQLGEAFDATWKRDNQRDSVPVPSDNDYEMYYLERADFIDAKQGIGSDKDRKLRRDIFGLARVKKVIASSGINPKDHPSYDEQIKYENDIKLAKVDSIAFEMWKIADAALNHPLTGDFIKDKIKTETTLEEGDERVIYEDKADYYVTTIKSSMEGFNAYFYPKD